MDTITKKAVVDAASLHKDVLLLIDNKPPDQVMPALTLAMAKTLTAYLEPHEQGKALKLLEKTLRQQTKILNSVLEAQGMVPGQRTVQ